MATLHTPNSYPPGATPAQALTFVLYLAALAALLWLTLPIQAATILIPIQRMAALSTTFVLLGVVVYLTGLQLQTRGY